MRALFDNEFAPLTYHWGFLKIPLDKFAHAYSDWWLRIGEPKSLTHKDLPLWEAMGCLEPLSMPPTKSLLVGTHSEWSAYFDNGINGGDPASTIEYLSEHLKCWGLMVSSIPHTLTVQTKTARGTYGSIQFELFAPERTNWHDNSSWVGSKNLLRSVGIWNDGGPWRFNDYGIMQPYEHHERYAAKRLRDRFSNDLLEEYCAALGIDLFSEDFYTSNSILITRPDGKGANRFETLPESRKRLGIE